MKGQMALLEAFASLVLLTSGGLIVAEGAYTASLHQSYPNPAFQDFFYDFFSDGYANTSMSACLASQNQSCASHTLDDFADAYGVRGGYLSIGSARIVYGSEAGCSYSKTECFPLPYNGSYTQECLYACGG